MASSTTPTACNGHGCTRRVVLAILVLLSCLANLMSVHGWVLTRLLGLGHTMLLLCLWFLPNVSLRGTQVLPLVAAVCQNVYAVHATKAWNQCTRDDACDTMVVLACNVSASVWIVLSITTRFVVGWFDKTVEPECDNATFVIVNDDDDDEVVSEYVPQDDDILLDHLQHPMDATNQNDPLHGASAAFANGLDDWRVSSRRHFGEQTTTTAVEDRSMEVGERFVFALPEAALDHRHAADEYTNGIEGFDVLDRIDFHHHRLALELDTARANPSAPVPDHLYPGAGSESQHHEHTHDIGDSVAALERHSLKHQAGASFLSPDASRAVRERKQHKRHNDTSDSSDDDDDDDSSDDDEEEEEDDDRPTTSVVARRSRHTNVCRSSSSSSSSDGDHNPPQHSKFTVESSDSESSDSDEDDVDDEDDNDDQPMDIPEDNHQPVTVFAVEQTTTMTTTGQELSDTSSPNDAPQESVLATKANEYDDTMMEEKEPAETEISNDALMWQEDSQNQDGLDAAAVQKDTSNHTETTKKEGPHTDTDSNVINSKRKGLAKTTGLDDDDDNDDEKGDGQVETVVWTVYESSDGEQERKASVVQADRVVLTVDESSDADSSSDNDDDNDVVVVEVKDNGELKSKTILEKSKDALKDTVNKSSLTGSDGKRRTNESMDESVLTKKLKIDSPAQSKLPLPWSFNPSKASVAFSNAESWSTNAGVAMESPPMPAAPSDESPLPPTKPAKSGEPAPCASETKTSLLVATENLNKELVLKHKQLLALITSPACKLATAPKTLFSLSDEQSQKTIPHRRGQSLSQKPTPATKPVPFKVAYIPSKKPTPATKAVPFKVAYSPSKATARPLEGKRIVTRNPYKPSCSPAKPSLAMATGSPSTAKTDQRIRSSAQFMFSTWSAPSQATPSHSKPPPLASPRAVQQPKVIPSHSSTGVAGGVTSFTFARAPSSSKTTSSPSKSAMPSASASAVQPPSKVEPSPPSLAAFNAKTHSEYFGPSHKAPMSHCTPLNYRTDLPTTSVAPSHSAATSSNANPTLSRTVQFERKTKPAPSTAVGVLVKATPSASTATTAQASNVKASHSTKPAVSFQSWPSRAVPAVVGAAPSQSSLQLPTKQTQSKAMTSPLASKVRTTPSFKATSSSSTTPFKPTAPSSDAMTPTDPWSMQSL